ncbi:radical SAM protein [Desulfosarcina ovata]|uniref:Radical SAM protein n=1 Tax=Desulfosarcina ovata subsp. ovata TaxID=2752305 RepID=A0A5K8AJI7_9BACT|nr:radical SAM protein [Desulfosarcina ovata]BBO92873.1 radical SAM protein [Desulfosarcina ovata subsp. ovata]
MECAVITTYRCNAKCGMCDTWKYPSKASEEFDPKILEKIPPGMTRLNITGGEPMLRKDIGDIVRILDKKSDRLEISTNGYFTDRIESVARKFPDITVRVSVEGLPALNDRLRGIKNGFDRALRTVLRLKRMGVKDIGFAMTISGDNCHDLMDFHTLVSALDVEFANAIIHNSFYFHKNDNKIENADEVQDAIIRFMEALLQSPRRNIKRRLKDWFRAYINLGLLMHLKGEERPIACGAATDTFFLDPWGQVLACNGSSEPMIMGNLVDQSFEEIWNSEQAEKIRRQVSDCKQNCWMTGTAVPAMRKKPWRPIKWVLENKLRLYRGQEICL